MSKYNKCFSIGTTFSSKEFADIEARAMEYAGDAAVANQHYAAAASDILSESRAVLQKIMDAADKKFPAKTPETPREVPEEKPPEVVEAKEAPKDAPKEEPTKEEPEAAPAGPTRFSRTEAFKKWFGNSKIVNEDGSPKQMYHGTARDITAFRAKQAGAIFVTDRPEFAENFASASEQYLAGDYKDILTEAEIKAAQKETVAAIKADLGSTNAWAKEMIASVNAGSPKGEALDMFNAALLNQMPSKANIMPLYVKAENPFDYSNPDHASRVAEYVSKIDKGGANEAGISSGQWGIIESGSVQKAIRALGHDGFYVVEGGVKNLAVYEPTQLKSVTGNNGEYSSTNPDIRFSRNATKMMTVQESLAFASSGKIPFTLGDAIRRRDWATAFMLSKDKTERQQLLSGLGDRTIAAMADGLIPVQRWIEALPMSGLFKQRLLGDLRRSDTLRSAKEKEVSSAFSEDMYKAIEAAAKGSKYSADEMKKLSGQWMTAKYAPKANRLLIAKDRAALVAAQASADPVKIAEAQQNLADRLADVRGPVGATGFKRGVAGGFNDATAAKIVADIEAKVTPQLLSDIAKPVYAMLAWKKNLDLQSGKVTQTMVNSWPNHGDYVPLTGDPRYNKDTDDIFQYGNQLNQDADKAINGRKDSIADDGIDAAYTAVMKSINFSAFQDFKRSVNAAYESAQRSGTDIGIKRVPVSGIIRNSDDVMIYRDNVGGSMKAYAFKFDDQRIIDAIKKSSSENLNAFLSLIATPTRWYGRFVTQFAPVFAPINFVRDMWERSEFLRIKTIYDTNGVKINVDKAARDAIAASINPQLWKASLGVNFATSGQSAVRNDLEEMISLGGSSTWGDYLAKNASDLEADIRKNVGAVNGITKKAMKVIEGYNNTFEMIAPLAIYRALKAQGVSPKDASAATLDLMNFKKRGTVMPAIKSLYVFAQPAATSGYNLAQYLSTSKGRNRFVAQLLVGTMLYAFLRGAWGDEEEEELGNKLDNLSNWTVERTIPLKIGDYVVKVPVGFGAPQLAWSTAGIINRLISGRYDTATALGEAAKAWAKSASPVAPSDMELTKRPVDWLMTTIIPTVARPLFNIYADQTGLGSPLTPGFKNEKKMKFEQANRTTASAYSDLAKSIHETTGMDIYPDHIKALSDGYLIGPMREAISYFIDTPSKEARGEKARIPIIASLVDNLNDRQILNSVYYRYRDEISGVAKEYESRMARNDLADWVTPEKTQQMIAFKQFKSAEEILARQRTLLKKMKLEPEAESIRLQAIEEQADQSHKRVLLQYLRQK